MTTICNPKTDINEMKRAMSLLYQPGDVVELRAIDQNGYIAAGYFDDFKKLAMTAFALSESGKMTAIYTVPNPVKKELLARAANHLYPDKKKDKKLTQDPDVLKRRWFLIDADADRAAGISSTDEEHDIALKTVINIKSYLISLGFNPDSIVVADSGNGAHLLVRIDDIPNDADSLSLVKSCTAALKAKFDTDKVSIDAAVVNPSRVWKLYGTVCCKGDSTEDRPHRAAKLLEVPAHVVVTPIELLKKLAALVPQPEMSPTSKTTYHSNSTDQTFDVERWMADHNIDVLRTEVENGTTKYILKVCPFNPEHNNNATAAVFKMVDGTLGFKCHHDGCTGNDWKQLRTKLDPEYAKKKRQYEEKQPNHEYVTADKFGDEKLDITMLVVDIMRETRFVFMKDNDVGLYYDNGIYHEGAERCIAARCQQLVGINPVLTTHAINEIIGHIKRSSYHDRNEFNLDKTVINVKNGLLNILTGELREHTPDYLCNVQIPVTYDPKADCPKIKKFLKEIHPAEDVPVMQEIFGLCLTRDNKFCKSILQIGEGANGKSTEQNVFKTFLGPNNCAHKSWQQLETNRFATSTLEGKLVNMFADLPSKSIETTTAFKMLTSGDPIDAERKFKDAYSFLSFAKLIFSTNKPPKIYNEDSFAFWRRWIILQYPFQFTNVNGNVNLNMLEELTSPEELSGLLNYALQGLKRLLTKGEFSYAMSVENIAEFYQQAADPVYAFAMGKCELDVTATTVKTELYDAYVKFCLAKKLPVQKPNSFARSLVNQVTFHVTDTKIKVGGKRIPAFVGIKLQEMTTPDTPVRVLSQQQPLKLDTTVHDVRDVQDFPTCNLPNNTPIPHDVPSVESDESKNEMGKNPANPDNPDKKQLTLLTDTPKRLETLENCPDCGSENIGAWPDGTDGYYCMDCNPNFNQEVE